MVRSLLIIVFTVLFIQACKSPSSSTPISFYYWRTDFALHMAEQNCLSDNNVHKLYVRYCDLIYDESEALVRPEAVLRFVEKPDTTIGIVPVVFIKNKVWEHLDSTAIRHTAQKLINLITQINTSSGGQSFKELQMDCDWSERTAAKYFYFLSCIHQMGDSVCGEDILLSATIRLHQVKYREQQGIPSVDQGVLMFYNMGPIDAGPGNSIYEKRLAAKYIAYAKAYPKPLKLALPVFSWLVHIRNGKVIGLINKFDIEPILNSGSLKLIGENRFVVTEPRFVQGRYLRNGDELKRERVSETELTDIAAAAAKAYGVPFRELLFFDLDQQNIQRYDKALFQKIAAAL